MTQYIGNQLVSTGNKIVERDLRMSLKASKNKKNGDIMIEIGYVKDKEEVVIYDHENGEEIGRIQYKIEDNELEKISIHFGIWNDGDMKDCKRLIEEE